MQLINNMDATAAEIAKHYTAMGHSVDEINGGAAVDETDVEWAERKARNVDHLIIMKARKHENGTSWWTSESFTAIDAAIAS